MVMVVRGGVSAARLATAIGIERCHPGNQAL
jgi:hypothetical protein